MADVTAQAATDLDQQRVPGCVAERVVDLLEVIQIDEEQAQRAARAPRAGDCLLESVVEEQPIGQAGQHVVGRAVLAATTIGLGLDGRAVAARRVGERAHQQRRIGVSLHQVGVRAALRGFQGELLADVAGHHDDGGLAGDRSQTREGLDAAAVG